MIYPAFSIAMFLASIVCLKSAYPKKKNLTLYLTSLIYGLLLEKFSIIIFNEYSYPAAEYFFSIRGIPIAIALGWSAAIYSSYYIGKAIGFNKKILPFFTGLFVLHIDFAMDPVASEVPYWTWTPPGPFFGVILANFFGWFMVAGLFTGFYEELTEKLENQILIGITTLIASLISLLLVLRTWFLITDTTFSKIIVLTLIIGIAIIAIYTNRNTINPQKLDTKLFLSTWIYHGFFLIILLQQNLHTKKPPLILINISMITINLFIYKKLSKRNLST